MSNEFTPQQLNLSPDTVVVIGTVALPSGPVRVSVSTAPKIAIAQNVSGYSSVKNVGKEDSMVTITAIFNDEFVDDASIDYKGMKIPADMYSLLSLLELMPFVPIYSSELAKLIAANTSSDYFFGALQSIAVRQYSDFDRTFEVTMSFLITDISLYMGNVVGYKEQIGDVQSAVGAMYLSSYIKGLVAQEKRDKITSASNANNILIGIDSFTVINNFNSYIRKMRNIISDISEAASQQFNTEQIKQEIDRLEASINKSLIYTFNEMNKEIKRVSTDSSIVTSAFSITSEESSLFKILLDNIVNISVGYDNYMNPTYMQGSSTPIHSFMGRSPVSAEVSFVCPNANDVLVFKTLYNFIQKMHRDIDFLGYSMPATLTGEIFNLIGMRNATITKIDVSSMDEVPNSFMVNIVFVDGSKGVMTESASATILDNIDELAKKVSEAAFKEIRNIGGTETSGLMQYFLDNDFEQIQNQISDTEELNRSLIVDVARIVDAMAQAVSDISVSAAIAKLSYDNENMDCRFIKDYIYPLYVDEQIEPINSQFTSRYNGNEKLARNFVSLYSAINDSSIDTEYQKILDSLYSCSVNGKLNDYMSMVFHDMFTISGAYEEPEEGTDPYQEVNKFYGKIPLTSNLGIDKQTLEFPDYTTYEFGQSAKEEYFPDISGFKIAHHLTNREFDYLSEFLSAYECAGFSNYDINTHTGIYKVFYGAERPSLKQILSNRIDLIEQYVSEIIDSQILMINTKENFSRNKINDTKKFISALNDLKKELEKAYDEAEAIDRNIQKEKSKTKFEPKENLFNNYSRYFEFSGMMGQLLMDITTGEETLTNKERATESFGSLFEYKVEEIAYDQLYDDISFGLTVSYEKSEEDSLKQIEIDKDVFEHVTKIPGLFLRSISKPNKAKEIIDKCFLQSEKVLQSYYIFQYNLSKAIATSDEVLMRGYGTVIQEAIMDEALKEYTLINPYDFFVEGHDFRVIDSFVSKSNKIATLAGSSYSDKAFIEDEISYEGELKSYSSDPLVNGFITDLKDQIGKCNYYLKNNEYSDDNIIKQYKEVLAEFIAEGSTGYVDGEQVEKLFDKLEKKGFIEITLENDVPIAKVNETTIDQDQSNAEEFRNIMKDLFIKGRLNEGYLTSSSYSDQTFRKQLFSIADGVRSSTLGIHDMCPQMFSVFLWTKNNIFIPTQYMFEYRGIISAEIQKSREDPSDKAIVVFSNTRSILTDSTTNDYQYMTKDPEGLATSIDKLLVKEGVVMQLITFSKGKKQKIFEGIISGVQYQNNTVTVIADGYGSALQKPVYTKEKEKLGGRCTNPREMVIDAINRTESIRLGCNEGGYINLLKRYVENMNSKGELFLYSDKYFMRQLRFSDLGINVYSPDQYWPLLLKSKIKGTSYFEQYQADYRVKAGYSAWDVVIDSLNRVPGFIARVVDFDAGNGRLFFGKPEWSYAYTSKLDQSFWKNAANNILKNIKSKDDVISNTFNDQIANYEQNIIKEVESYVFDDFEVIEMYSESIKGFTFNVPEDIPIAIEAEGTVLTDVKNSGSEPDTYLYDGDTLYSSAIEGAHTGYRFIGYDAEELKDDNDKLIDLGLNHRDAAFALIRHSGNRILLVSTGSTDNYGRHIVYPYIKYNGSMESLKGEWVSLSSLMIASGYINELLFGYHQDSEFLKKNIRYYNHYNDSKVYESKFAGSESNLGIFKSITEIYLGRFEEQIEHIKTFINEQNSAVDKKTQSTYFYDNPYYPITGVNLGLFVDKYKSAFETIYTMYNDGKQSVVKYVDNIVYRGNIDNSPLENVIVEPLNAVYSAILTVAAEMSDGIRLAGQIMNLEKSLEDPEQRLFEVINDMSEARMYMDLPGTKMYKNDWIAMSRVNLIDNGIMTDSSNVFNQVMITGKRNDYDTWPVFKQLWRFIKYVFGATEGNLDGDKQSHLIMADNDIPEWERKTLMAEDESADTFQTRIIVGTNILINSLKNMYQGEVTIIGNPSIKPHDSLYIHDEQNDIDGTATVRTVRHHFGQGIGFVTRIEVDPIIEARDLSVSTSGIWLGRLAKVAIGAGLIAAGIATGGATLLPALGGIAAGAAMSRGITSLFGSTLLEHGNLSAVSAKKMYDSDASNAGAYISTTEAFNLLKIKPLSKSNRPLVAGIPGYSVTEMNSWKYRMDKNKEGWENFIMGLKMFGYSYQYLFEYSNLKTSQMISDLLQYWESIKND